MLIYRSHVTILTIWLVRLATSHDWYDRWMADCVLKIGLFEMIWFRSLRGCRWQFRRSRAHLVTLPEIRNIRSNFICQSSALRKGLVLIIFWDNSFFRGPKLLSHLQNVASSPQIEQDSAEIFGKTCSNSLERSQKIYESCRDHRVAPKQRRMIKYLLANICLDTTEIEHTSGWVCW